MRWDEVRWDEIRWDEVRWNEVKWNEMWGHKYVHHDMRRRMNPIVQCVRLTHCTYCTAKLSWPLKSVWMKRKSPLLYMVCSLQVTAVPYMIFGLSVTNAVYGIRFRGTGRCEPTRQECSVLFFPVLFYSTVSTTDVILYNYMPHFSYVIIMIVRSAASVQSSTVKSFFSFLCCWGK